MIMNEHLLFAAIGALLIVAVFAFGHFIGKQEGYLQASEERQDDFTNMDRHL